MIDQLFEDSGMDPMDTMAFQFYDCVLKRSIGIYAKGSVIPFVFVDFERGFMKFFSVEGEEIDTFNLRLEVA